MSTLKKGGRGHMVKILQHWLNVLVAPRPALVEDGGFGAQTEAAVKIFKTRYCVKPVTGEVDPKTWAAIGKELGQRAWLTEGMPLTLMRILQDVAVGPLNFRHDYFFKAYMEEYGGIDQSQMKGLADLLRFIDRDADVNDVRWGAYMLATVKHECADTWQPIEEYGKGSGRPYGNPVEVIGSDGRKYQNAYYGRGYVQLTWKKNYEDMGKALDLGDKLVTHPALVLDPVTAYRIMSHGMRHGSFTGKKLGDYIAGKSCDYFNARRIINGTDEAERIKGYAEKIEVMLRASLYVG